MGSAASSNWPDQLHAHRIPLDVTRGANRPGKTASREPLAERRAQPVTGIRRHTAETHISAIRRSISASAIYGFIRGVRNSTGTPARFKRTESLAPVSSSPTPHLCRRRAGSLE
jgi:hypothetical protein